MWQCSTSIFDLRARVFYEPVKLRILAILKITEKMTMREVARKSLLILSFFLTANRKFRWLLKSWEMSNVEQDFEDLRSSNFVDIGRIREVPAAIENFIVNGADEKSWTHRLESRICTWQSIVFYAITAGDTISLSSFEGFVKKNRTRMEIIFSIDEDSMHRAKCAKNMRSYKEL